MNPDIPLNSLLRCPDCRTDMLVKTANSSWIYCRTCGAQFAFSHGRPVLLRHDNQLFRVDDYLGVPPQAQRKQFSKDLADILTSPSINLSRQRLLTQLKGILQDFGGATVLVVGGGNQRVWLDKILGVGDSIRVIYSDVDVKADVDIFCDAHELPFVDGCFDAVITTAVLEHVLYPERVAAEMQRVLRVGGLLYSELPFMQQVHEGAYDFTRYTLSGHRRLLNYIDSIESGMVAGPATALAWAVENFALAFVTGQTSAKWAKAAVRLFCGWLKYFDYLLANRPQAMDGASCTYLFGRKIEGRVTDGDIIAGYVGNKLLTHT